MYNYQVLYALVVKRIIHVQCINIAMQLIKILIPALGSITSTSTGVSSQPRQVLVHGLYLDNQLVLQTTTSQALLGIHPMHRSGNNFTYRYKKLQYLPTYLPMTQLGKYQYCTYLPTPYTCTTQTDTRTTSTPIVVTHLHQPYTHLDSTSAVHYFVSFLVKRLYLLFSCFLSLSL